MEKFFSFNQSEKEVRLQIALEDMKDVNVEVLPQLVVVRNSKGFLILFFILASYI